MEEKLEHYLVKIFSFLIKQMNIYLEYIRNKYQKVQSKFQFLIPNDEAEHIEVYSNALNDALRNKKIRNIAVSGSYGSGKSSFLKTFEKNHENGVYEFLDISLARFNKTEEADNTINPSLIEKSILEQMFYKVESKKIPQSRLNKINRLKLLQSKVWSILIVILCSFIVFKPEVFSDIALFKDILELVQQDYIKYIPIAILIAGAYYFIRKLLFLLSNTSIDKVNLKDLEIVSNDKKNESLLNKHLDEILYFFEQTRFNVVVFQDLDRFKNLDIFTKLRELNNFINNSEQVDRDIRFIYAVKDEMFCDSHERTKFFDFVIPIIPYINATNSKEKLMEFFKDDVKHKFLYDISLYISDMRLLKNIYNEYTIYSKNLDIKLDRTKLLAMIIYKNFEPQDFEKLHKYEGLVFNIFNNKATYIETVVKKIEEKSKELETKIKEIDDEPQKEIQELQQIYLFKIIEKFHNQNNGTLTINNSNTISIQNMSNEDFKLIANSNKIKSKYLQGHYHSESQTINFKDIENEVNSKYSYEQREQFILDKYNNKKDELLTQIQSLEDEKKEIEEYLIQKIIENYKEVEVFDNSFDKKPLLKYLISYGHIDKYYDIYMSNFYGVTISKGEQDFLLNIKNNGKHFKFEYELNNLDEILRKERLEISEFKKESILNYNLINHIMNKKKDYSRQYVQIFKQLANSSDVSNDFIFSYLDTQKNVNAFLNGVIKYYSSIWECIVTSDKFTSDQQEKYFYVLLHNLEFEDILRLNIDDSLKNYIRSKTEFYHIPNEAFNKRLEEVIKRLGIKFELFKDHTERITPFQFIYENNYYELNEEMINYVVYAQSDFDSTVYEELKKAHYTTILNSNAKYLKEYINKNINEYIENVFLNIDTNVEEDEKTVIDLLNNSDIDDAFKAKIIQKEESKIFDINSIENQELWHILLEENKLVANWDNLLYYYTNNENDFNVKLIDFLNIEENYKVLANLRINNEKDFEKDTILESFNKEIMLSNQISDNAYEYLIKSVWFWKYPQLDIEHLSSRKIELMLEHTKFKFNNENFKNLKEKFNPLHIILIENNIDDLIENYEAFGFDTNDIIKLLESTKILPKIKKEIIEKMDYNLISTPKIAKLIYSNIDKTIIKPYEYIKNMILQLESLEFKVNLLVEQQSELNDEELIGMLELMPEEYSKIAKLDGKHTVIVETDYNKTFIKLLYSREFITKDKPEKKNQIRLIIKNRKV